MKQLSDDELIEGYKAGAPEAFQHVDRWIQMVVRSRNWGLYDHQEDIIQDIRRRLYENLIYDRFRRGSSLKTYVVQISKYVCIEFLRQKIRHQASDIDSMQLRDPAAGPHRDLEVSQQAELAQEAMAQMPEGCRELFDMIFKQELPYQEISQRLGIAEGTVKSRAWRCRENLFSYMKRKGYRSA